MLIYITMNFRNFTQKGNYFFQKSLSSMGKKRGFFKIRAARIEGIDDI